MGWTNRGSETPAPRQDIPPENFYEEKIPADPACAAWNEPGYVDPELAHADLPLGAHYWQGFAKRSATLSGARARNRAMSPGWVTHVTEAGGTVTPPPFEESDPPDPLEPRVVREKETGLLSRLRATFWPG